MLKIGNYLSIFVLNSDVFMDYVLVLFKGKVLLANFTDASYLKSMGAEVFILVIVYVN